MNGFPAAAAAADPHYDALASTVQIRRDEWGVPHILAENEEGAALALGYVQGEDYPDLLPRLFTEATGESAKYFGARQITRDLQVKRYRFFEDSVERFGELRPDIQAALNAFAAGYNMSLAKRPDRPVWATPVTGAHVLAYGRVLVVLEFTHQINVAANVPNRPSADETAAAFEPHAILPGSNMWAIGKERSASGRGMLLANPHLQWSGSQIFYEAHVTIPGKVNVSGCTLLGSPGITIGFNEHLGWSHTVNIFDSHDAFELSPDPEKPDHYLYGGVSVPIRKREIAIEVAGENGEVSTRTETVLDTHFGPVVREKDGVRWAMKTPNDREIRMMEQWHEMGRAKSLADFRRALDIQALPMFNIALADREGNCFYIYNGRIPKRREGRDWTQAAPGDDPAWEWSVVHPIADLPQLTNPPGGYVQNCNDAPWYTNLNALIDKTAFADYVCKDQLGLRTQHSLKMLEEDDSIALDEIKERKFTTLVLGAAWHKGPLIETLEKIENPSDRMREAIALLKEWDDHADWDARAAMLFEAWIKRYTAKAKPKWAVEWNPADSLNTPRGIGDPEKAISSMEEAIAAMVETYGKLDPAYGDVNRLIRGGKSFPLAGGAGQFGFFRVLSLANVPKDKAATPGERYAVGGDSYVLAVEFTDPPTAWTIVAYGQTEREDSPHCTDQSELFARHEWKRAYFAEEDVLAHAKRTYRPGE